MNYLGNSRTGSFLEDVLIFLLNDVQHNTMALCHRSNVETISHNEQDKLQQDALQGRH